MNDEDFWGVIERAYDPKLAVREEKLMAALMELSEEEVMAFDRKWTECYFRLYTWLLWGAAYLAQGGCSDDGFMDWRNWVISCGREAYETALERPDDLGPLVEREPDAGNEGMGYVAPRVLDRKNPQWKGSPPRLEGLVPPDEPAGPEWTDDEDLERLLPKMYAWSLQREAVLAEQLKKKRPWWKFWG